jgi:rsbT co-antagonist protein RsbR
VLQGTIRLKQLMNRFTTVRTEPGSPGVPTWQRLLGLITILPGLVVILLLPLQSAALQAVAKTTTLWDIGTAMRAVLVIGTGVSIASALRWRTTTAIEQRKGNILALISLFVLLLVLVITVAEALTNQVFVQYALFSTAYFMMIAINIQSLWLVRHGHVSTAAFTTLFNLFVQVIINLGVSPLSVSFAICVLAVLVAGLLLRWWVGLCIAGLYPVVVLGATQLFGLRESLQLTPIVLVLYGTLLLLFAGIIALYARSLEHALGEADQRAQALLQAQNSLERANSDLEQRVAERTAALSQALTEQAAQAVSLQESLAEQQRLNQAISDLSFPVIPVRGDTLILPLIGVLAGSRAADLIDVALRHVQQSRARLLFLDVTGVAVVDTAVAQALLRLATAVRMLGAETILVGIRPEVAQTLVSLGVDMGTLRTAASLQAGLDMTGVIRAVTR